MNQPILLFIETSTEVCSVALSSGETIKDEIIVREPRSHAKVIGKIIEDITSKNGITVNDCDAVVVSEGPGSYTGLRVGVSIAKGLCYASGKPLIAVGSLRLLASLACNDSTLRSHIDSNTLIVPMIDARRMEVYTATFDTNNNQICDTNAMIIDENSFADTLATHKVIFTGDGAKKASTVIKSPNAIFHNGETLAKGMLQQALILYKEGRFVDTAYFEPFYLKDFVAGVSKKRLF